MTLNLAELKELAAAATPGPLVVEYDNDDHGNHWWRVDGARFTEEADAKLYAASRTAIPALVAEVERLREALEKCKTHIGGYCVTSEKQYSALVETFLEEIRRVDHIARAALGGKHE